MEGWATLRVGFLVEQTTGAEACRSKGGDSRRVGADEDVCRPREYIFPAKSPLFPAHLPSVKEWEMMIAASDYRSTIATFEKTENKPIWRVSRPRQVQTSLNLPPGRATNRILLVTIAHPIGTL